MITRYEGADKVADVTASQSKNCSKYDNDFV